MRHLMLLGAMMPALVWAGGPPGLRTTSEGVLYRVIASEESSPVPVPEYKIVERDPDDEDVARRVIQYSLRDPLPLRQAVTLMLAEHELAVRFTGTRAMDAATKPASSAMFSGSLKGALMGLARQAGLQVAIRHDYVEFSDRRSYQLRLPHFENASDVATRIQGTRATNVKVTGAALIFDADPDALRDVEKAVREIKAGRRGTGSFLAAMAARDGRRNGAGDPVRTAKDFQGAESAAVAKLGNAPAMPTIQDPLRRLVSLEFEGDVTEALRRLAGQGGVHFKLRKPITRQLSVALKVRQEPLSSVLASIASQLKSAADIEYVRTAQRIDLVPR